MCRLIFVSRWLICVCVALSLAHSSFAATNVVLIGSYFYNPSNSSINAGDTIRWSNTTAIAHDTTSRTTNNGTALWASPILTNPITTFAFTFTNAGIYPYYCYVHRANHPEQTGLVSVASVNLPPSVSLTNPAGGAKFLAPANIPLIATASDSGGSVTNVQFFSGANLLGNATASPYNLTVSNVAAGNYSYTARATDNAGASATSAVVNVFVLTNAVLENPVSLGNGQFALTILGVAGQTYATETSTDRTNWTAVLTNVAPAGNFNVTDAISTNALQRFYRARQDF